MSSQYGLMRELRGTTCRCGSEKNQRQTFCKRCYFFLTKEQRAALYRKIGDGYEEAYDDAVASLSAGGVFEVDS